MRCTPPSRSSRREIAGVGDLHTETLTARSACKAPTRCSYTSTAAVEPATHNGSRPSGSQATHHRDPGDLPITPDPKSAAWKPVDWAFCGFTGANSRPQCPARDGGTISARRP